MPEKLGQTIELRSLDHDAILRSLQVPLLESSRKQDREYCVRIQEQVRICEKEVLAVMVPRAVWRILPVEELEPILRGKDIRRLLEGCPEAVLMALTLGSELERRLMREEVTNMSNAYVLDVCASQAVEDAADEMERRLRAEIRLKGKYLTNRYSPGYGDFPLGIQRSVLEYLNAARAIGLTLTPTNLMVPRKSITAVMGIGDTAKPDVYGGCTNCPLQTKCSWREHGERCYRKDEE